MANGGLSESSILPESRVAPDARVARIFLDDASALSGTTMTIQGRAVRRLSRVLRLRRGDALEVIHDDQLYVVQLTRVRQDVAEGEVTASRPVEVNRPPLVTLCPAVIRPQRFEMVIEKATELGVDHVRPVRAIRSLAKSQSGERIARWKRIVTEASEQCRREQRPSIDEPVDLETLVAAAAGPATVRIMASAWERSRRIGEVLDDVEAPQAVEILVGPEGGFTPGEAELAEANGWIPVTLGPRPLRAETAGMVAAAVVQEALLRSRD